MILAEDLDIMNWNSNMNLARSEGKAEGITAGRAEGQTSIVELNKWLFSQGRIDDIKKYTDDPGYLESLLKEYAASNPQADSSANIS